MNKEISKLSTLAKSINESHHACEDAADTAIEHARDAGDMLIEAKSQIPHGRWLPWLTENVECSERNAQNYMKIAREWDRLQSNTKRVSDLPLRDGLKLLATERPDDDKPAPGPLPTAGKKLVAMTQTTGGRYSVIVEIQPSIADGFFHCTTSYLSEDEGEDESYQEFSKKPVRGDFVHRFILNQNDQIDGKLLEWREYEDDQPQTTVYHRYHQPQWLKSSPAMDEQNRAERLEAETSKIRTELQKVIDNVREIEAMSGEPLDQILFGIFGGDSAMSEIVKSAVKLPA